MVVNDLHVNLTILTIFCAVQWIILLDIFFFENGFQKSPNSLSLIDFSRTKNISNEDMSWSHWELVILMRESWIAKC